MESLIGGPELEMTECRRGQQVDVGPSEPASGEAVLLEKVQRFVVGGAGRCREPLQEVQRGGALAQRAARELTDDRGMTGHGTGVQQIDEGRSVATETANPSRSVVA